MTRFPVIKLSTATTPLTAANVPRVAEAGGQTGWAVSGFTTHDQGMNWDRISLSDAVILLFVDCAEAIAKLLTSMEASSRHEREDIVLNGRKCSRLSTELEERAHDERKDN